LSGHRPIGLGRGPPKAEIPVRPRMAGPYGPVGELESPVPCHGTDRRFKSGQARQVCEVQFDRDRSRHLNAVRRDRYPRTSPSRRTRPEYRGRSFKPLQAGSTPVGVTKLSGAGPWPALLKPSVRSKFSGSKLIRMSSRLLIGRQPVRFRPDPPGCSGLAQR
jgi:hypothetical protein